jgi:uncharacterized membrane protein YbaN (DUF454 family)
LDHLEPRAVGTKRIALFAGGCSALVLAVVGAILPVMPTTPFIILAVYCFARSSARCHTWLTNNRLFGRYVTQVVQGRPLSRRAKTALIASCWITAVISAVFLAPNLPIRLAGLSIAAGMTGYLLLRERKQPRSEAVRRRSSPR